MTAGISRDHPDHVFRVKDVNVLRTAVVFGSNGSGKSNLVKAMAASRNLVFGFPIPKNDYCRTDPENSKRPTSFEYTVEISGTLYAYGVEVMLSTGEISAEWLLNLSSRKKDNAVFQRSGDMITTGLTLSQDDQKYFDVYSMEAKNNRRITFLMIMSKVPERKGSRLSPIGRFMRWFQGSLRIIGPGSPTGFIFNPNLSRFTGKILPRYGTGISGINFVDTESIGEQIPPSLMDEINISLSVDPAHISTLHTPFGIFTVSGSGTGKPKIAKMVFDHGGKVFDYAEESDGTRGLMELVPILNGDDPEDLTYVIDEIDRSLHPQLTQKLVSDFEALPASLKRQMIATTHEQRLLDLDLVRRDEIWFVEKDEGGDSRLYSLEAFSERKDRRIERAYMDGRYGAVPCFRELFPNLDRDEAYRIDQSAARLRAAELQEKVSDCFRGLHNRAELFLGVVPVSEKSSPLPHGRCGGHREIFPSGRIQRSP